MPATAPCCKPPVADFKLELERMKLVPAQTRAVPLANGQKYFDQSTEVEMADLRRRAQA